jgi:flagella basal body P-ring formation protein FlgA
LDSRIKKEISKSYAGARIDLLSDVKWTVGNPLVNPRNILIMSDDGKGNLRFSTTDSQTGSYSEGWISFAAWLPAKVALQRIRPGQALSADLFVTQEVNVSTGQAREYRAVILQDDLDLARLEATQTILEGQFLLSTGIKRTPDIRRGDTVRIHLISGDLTLTTSGIAEEPAYLSSQVKVMTGKSKRELQGSLLPGGIVEVKL